MEGDVLTGNLPMLLGVAASVLGGVFALLKWFAGRLIADIEKRLERIDDLERRFDHLLTELPLHYQRRDDAIRELTAINAKLDKLYEFVVRRAQHNE